MSVARTVTVQLLDKEYAISCPDGAEAELLASADLLDTKMREIRDQAKLLGLERIAVMAGLNMAHEVLKKGQTTAVVTEEHLLRLANKIDRALTKAETNSAKQGLKSETGEDV